MIFNECHYEHRISNKQIFFLHLCQNVLLPSMLFSCSFHNFCCCCCCSHLKRKIVLLESHILRFVLITVSQISRDLINCYLLNYFTKINGSKEKKQHFLSAVNCNQITPIISSGKNSNFQNLPYEQFIYCQFE